MLDKGSSLDSWLQYIASVHPREIELGLARTQSVACRLGISKPAPLVVTVAGTNGKGSCVRAMEAILQQSGYTTGAYTSPHIHQFNERIRIAGNPVDDQLVVNAFADIDVAREGESLSYFEFATLAALYLFSKSDVDVTLLEVGLGGRLDAVNIIDPDVSVIASIGIDHTDWLGEDIEAIAAEKAGIMRENTPIVFGGAVLPKAVSNAAKALSAPLYRQGYEFSHEDEGQSWCWQGKSASGESNVLSSLPIPALALPNVATALQALSLLPLELQQSNIVLALSVLRLAGRFDCRRDITSARTVIFDVAHNPDAMELLAANLLRYRQQNKGSGRVAVVFSAMADKDVRGMLRALESCVDIWYIAQVDQARSMAADKVAQTMKSVRISGAMPHYRLFDSVELAYSAACEQLEQEDIVLVTGSFFTVAAVYSLSEQV